MILVHPPVAKPCEPPAGIARLLGVLSRHGVKCTVLDANLEGILTRLRGSCRASDTWTRRAVRNLPRNLAALRDPRTCRNLDRYGRAVMDLNRLAEMAGELDAARVSLANYQHLRLSPVRSEDLLHASRHPEEDPFHEYFELRLPEIVERQQPSVVGFSLNFLNQALCTFAMLGFLRRRFPHLKLVLGGGLVTSWMRRPGWKNPFTGLVDDMIAGPGEAPLLSMAGIDPAKADAGVCTPDYGPLPMDDYLSPGRVLPYSASSGCYWNRCSFCPERAEGNPYIPVSPRGAVSHLGELVERIRPSLVHILDNAVSPALMNALIDSPPGVPWYGFARIARRLSDPYFCRALRRSGCVMLKLGLESGDQDVLDRMGKGADLGVASMALKALEAAGIGTYVYLLFGTPPETPAAARRTLDFVVRHGESINFLNVALFNLPVYGPDCATLETRMHYEGELSLYTGFSHPLGWDRGLVRRFLDKEFKRHPVVAAILRNDPPVFTSNHAPFFVMAKSE